MTSFNEIDKDQPYRAKETDTLSAVSVMGMRREKTKKRNRRGRK